MLCLGHTQITSDCDADANVFSTHHYTATPEEAVADVLHAGTDVDCGGFVQEHGASALAKGLITKEDIETRLKFLFRMRESSPTWPSIRTNSIC